MGAEKWIDGDEALAEFRTTRLSGGALAPVILDSPVTLINADVGSGKSATLDRLLEHAPLVSAFDLIVVLAAQTRNLHERKLVRSPQPGSVLLRPRPRTDCGPLDAEWRRHERNGTTAYAKARVCGRCPRHAVCPWPRQYGAGLRGTRLVFGTHQHLLVNRRFLAHLRAMTGARRVLLFLDEADVLAASFRVALAPADLRRFRDAVGRASLAPGVRQRWLEQ